MEPQDFWLTRPLDRDPGRPSVAVAGQQRCRLLRRPCDTCVTFPDDRMHLGARREQFIAEAVARDSYVVCHETLGTDQPAICRGFWNQHRRDTAPLRVLATFNLVVEVDPSD